VRVTTRHAHCDKFLFEDLNLDVQLDILLEIMVSPASNSCLQIQAKIYSKLNCVCICHIGDISLVKPHCVQYVRRQNLDPAPRLTVPVIRFESHTAGWMKAKNQDSWWYSPRPKKSIIPVRAVRFRSNWWKL
jgi:hypothetical protein